MKSKFLLFVLLMTSSACAHVPKTCDMYCISRQGSCDYIINGSTKYNTITGATEERPTEFVCRYTW